MSLPSIKSYVIRGGRITKRQQEALECYLTQYQMPAQKRWDLPFIFGNNNPFIIEIGFGMGASLLEMAQVYPQLNFIGIEVHQAGIGSILAGLHDLEINNVKIMMKDAVEVFKFLVPPASLTGIQIFFPDPWQKKRHNKRRLIQKEFLELIVPTIKKEGFIHCVSDWEDYAQQIQRVLAEHPALSTVSKSTVPPLKKETKFENRARLLGHPIWNFIYYKS